MTESAPALTGRDISDFLRWARLLDAEALWRLRARSPEFFRVLLRLGNLCGQLAGIAGERSVRQLAGAARTMREANTNFLTELLKLDAAGHMPRSAIRSLLASQANTPAGPCASESVSSITRLAGRISPSLN